MKTISNVSFKGQKVLMRVDFNVPLSKDLKIIDDSRIKASLPSIKKFISDGAKLILMSHLGRPKNKRNIRFSTKNLIIYLSSLIGKKVIFSSACIGSSVESLIAKMKNGDVMLLENLRFYPEEISGNKLFAKKLSRLADVYVNDAFGVAHRKHASTAIVPRYFKKNKYAGFLLSGEISALDSVLKNTNRPFTAVLGGAKVSDKIGLIFSLLDRIDNLIIGGAMSYVFIKSFGGAVGDSLVEPNQAEVVNTLLATAKEKNVKLFLPIDSVNAKKASDSEAVFVSKITEIPTGYKGLDIGQKSVDLFSDVIAGSATVVWNGPMGVFEISAFSKGTLGVAKSVVKATENGGVSFVGGGDSASALKQFGLHESVSHLSTGGGAMFAYLEGRGLPAIEALDL